MYDGDDDGSWYDDYGQAYDEPYDEYEYAMVNASYGYDDDGQDWFYDDGSWTHEPDDTWDDAPDAIAAHIDASMPAHDDYSEWPTLASPDARDAHNESADEPSQPVSVSNVVTSPGNLQKTIAATLQQYKSCMTPQEGSDSESPKNVTFKLNVHYVINFVDKKNRPLGALLLDSGAQINIENDITCFTGYLERSDVKIGLANKNVLLRNGGVGTRRRRYRDTDGCGWIWEDTAFYCPDASHPIASVGDMRKKGCPFAPKHPASLCNHMYMPLAGPLCKILGSIPGSLRPLGEPIGPLECPRAPAGSRTITPKHTVSRRDLNQWPGGVQCR